MPRDVNRKNPGFFDFFFVNVKKIIDKTVLNAYNHICVTKWRMQTLRGVAQFG